VESGSVVVDAAGWELSSGVATSVCFRLDFLLFFFAIVDDHGGSRLYATATRKTMSTLYAPFKKTSKNRDDNAAGCLRGSTTREHVQDNTHAHYALYRKGRIAKVGVHREGTGPTGRSAQ
jgi:hypothetical protein